MARKKSLNLTDAELRLMDVIWEKGSATVGEVAEALPKTSVWPTTPFSPPCESWKRKVTWSTPSRKKAARSCIAPW